MGKKPLPSFSFWNDYKGSAKAGQDLESEFKRVYSDFWRGLTANSPHFSYSFSPKMSPKFCSKNLKIKPPSKSQGDSWKKSQILAAQILFPRTPITAANVFEMVYFPFFFFLFNTWIWSLSQQLSAEAFVETVESI